MPDGMREEIAASAMANGRTMNAEIILRLSGDGETMRDRFAGQIMASLISRPDNNADLPVLARISYQASDAMMVARKAGA